MYFAFVMCNINMFALVRLVSICSVLIVDMRAYVCSVYVCIQCSTFSYNLCLVYMRSFLERHDHHRYHYCIHRYKELP